MNKINTKTLKIFIPVILLFCLQSCETITSIPSKIVQGGSDTIDFVTSVFSDDSDDVEEINNKKDSENLSSAKPPENKLKEETPEVNKIEPTVDNQKIINQNLVESDQVLDAVPPEDLEVKNILEKEDKSYDSNLNKEKIKPIVSTKVDQELYNNTLNIKNKIQFRIATINFSAGSSTLNSLDLRKIKKVMSLAKEKNAVVKIVGHASTRTKDMPLLKHKLANFAISDKRSQAVAKVFIDNKFPLNKLITEAVSDSKPLFHESMPAGTYGNQRTEIYIIY
tara:strand:+ start:95 stop:934 length:840 start_codon:yes stop_codon:yes gene_type:complete